MLYLSSYLDFLTEALPLSVAKEFSQDWDENRLDDWFKGKHRIYIPLTKRVEAEELVASGVELQIKDYLQQEFRDRYDIDNYVEGYAVDSKNKNRPIRISQLITKERDLLRLYNEDPSRTGSRLKNKKVEVVISRHPYDIAGMSTDRGWTSCKNLGTEPIYGEKAKAKGEFSHFLEKEVKVLLIAYLILEKDKNIQNPIARVSIYPYVNDRTNDRIFLMNPNVYGNPGKLEKTFLDTVENWLVEKNSTKPKQYYSVEKGLYLDGMKTGYELGDSKFEQPPNWLSHRCRATIKQYKWRSGIFHWEDGVFHDGLFVEGVWENGVWENGVFEGGVWKNGRWKNGKWRGDEWRGGVWENGVWEGGEWRGGEWQKGVWEGGFWEAGRCKNCVWETGQFFNGVFEDSTFKDGTFYGGDVVNSLFLGGEMRGGVFKSGVFKNGDWREGDWQGGDWKKGSIYSNKFYAWVTSRIPPNEFYEFEEISTNLKELHQKLDDYFY